MSDDNDLGVPPDANVVMMDRELGTQVLNQSDLATAEIMRDGRVVGSNQPLMAALGQWTQNMRRQDQHRAGGILDRDRYVTPGAIFDQMRLAYQAVEDDDIISNIADASEAMAFNKVGFYADEEEEEDVYNQIAADINLDARVREMWRELFTVSQFVCAVWWHTKTYRVRGKGDAGRRRRKEYKVRCPKAITLLDPMKVIPVGNTMFNQEQLVYAADRAEHERFTNSARGADPIKDRLILARYNAGTEERSWVSSLGGDVSADRLWVLNPANVFRHSLTRSQFNAFATVRMKSVFELIDMKRQLREMDRAHALGGTNFIVLITKGSDTLPAKPEEIGHLQASVRTIARVPVMVGDHRLDVKIVTPPLDNMLKSERYGLLDGRITARLYHMFVLGGGGASGARGDDSLKLAKIIGRGMESRRHMMVRSIEENILNVIYDSNDNLESRPKLRFQPATIDVAFDSHRAAMVLDLRDRGELSRETALSTFEFDQDDEARYLEREHDDYDNTFRTINPYNQGVQQPGEGTTEEESGPETEAPDARTQRRAANEGRRRGGAAPGSGQGQSPRRPRRLSSEDEGERDD